MEQRRHTPVKIQMPEYGIRAFSSMHGKDFSMPMEHDSFYELFFIHQGRGICKTNTGEIQLVPNTLVLIHPEQPHQLIDDKKSPLSLYGVCFNPHQLNQYKDERELIEMFSSKMKKAGAVVFRNDYSVKTITDHIKEILFEQTERKMGYIPKVRHTLLSMLVTLTRTKSDAFSKNVKADPIDVSLEYISRNFYKPLVVHELATGCGLSTRRYTDLFKQKTGKTCINYINTLRLEYAQKRLQTNPDINMAMLDSGFYDLSHFYKLFKKHTGLTPKQFITQ